MKIGIMTFWMSKENYGQILQMYALSSFLTMLGHETFIVKYDGSDDISMQKSIFNRLSKVIKDPSKIIDYIKTQKRKRIIEDDLAVHDCEFDVFKNKYFKWSKLYVNYSDLKSDPPEADAFICGSDMIWTENSMPAPYFLEFVTNAKKIAYAPSFGANHISDMYKAQIKLYLDTFSLITTREESGVEICKQLGFNAYWVVDPTGLLTASDYSKIEETINIDKKYIFMYLLGHDTYVPLCDIKKFADKNEFSLIYRASQGRRDNLPKSYLTINQWIYAIHHAEYIITNSFHGCMFCVIFKKKFLYLPLINKSKASNERAFSLLNKLNLYDRIYRGDFSKICDDIDYDKVNSILSPWVNQSKRILISSLEL